MTPHREWFKYFKLGDDKTCTIIRKGKFKISLDDGGVRMLSEVHYIP